MDFAVIVIVALNFVFTVVAAVTTLTIANQLRMQNSQNARLIGQLASIHEKIGETHDRAKKLNEKTEEQIDKTKNELEELAKNGRRDAMKEHDSLKFLIQELQKTVDAQAGRR